MQKPFAYSPAHKIAQNFILTGRQISIIAVASAILLFLIGFEFLNMSRTVLFLRPASCQRECRCRSEPQA
jgi:hypothetical protein